MGKNLETTLGLNQTRVPVIMVRCTSLLSHITPTLNYLNNRIMRWLLQFRIFFQVAGPFDDKKNIKSGQIPQKKGITYNI